MRQGNGVIMLLLIYFWYIQLHSFNVHITEWHFYDLWLSSVLFVLLYHQSNKQTTICICMWILNLRWTTSQNNVQHENPGAMTKYVSNTCSDGNLITIVCILISLIAPLQLSSNTYHRMTFLWSLAVVSIVRIIILKVIFWTNKCMKAAEYTKCI
jgi:hypothetical protein